MASGRFRSTGRGTCRVCKRSVTASRMGVHLKSHLSDGGDASYNPYLPGGNRGSRYIIRVDDGGPFWMFLQVSGTRTLNGVDDFLRDEWLEESHLSVFTIGGIKYDSEPESAEHGESSMHHMLRDVPEGNAMFSYEYDFGTATRLRLTVTAARVPPLIPREGTAVLAMHDAVVFVCDVCGGEATRVCAYCSMLSDGSLLCDDCIKGHECYRSNPNAVLAVVQSPRVGICNFESPPKTLHAWQPDAPVRPGTPA